MLIVWTSTEVGSLSKTSSNHDLPINDVSYLMMLSHRYRPMHKCPDIARRLRGRPGNLERGAGAGFSKRYAGLGNFQTDKNKTPPRGGGC